MTCSFALFFAVTLPFLGSSHPASATQKSKSSDLLPPLHPELPQQLIHFLNPELFSDFRNPLAPNAEKGNSEGLIPVPEGLQIHPLPALQHRNSEEPLLPTVLPSIVKPLPVEDGPGAPANFAQGFASFLGGNFRRVVSPTSSV